MSVQPVAEDEVRKEKEESCYFVSKMDNFTPNKKFNPVKIQYEINCEEAHNYGTADYWIRHLL